MSKKRKLSAMPREGETVLFDAPVKPDPGEVLQVTVKEGCTHRTEYARESPAHAWVAVPCGCPK